MALVLGLELGFVLVLRWVGNRFRGWWPPRKGMRIAVTFGCLDQGIRTAPGAETTTMVFALAAATAFTVGHRYRGTGT